MRIRASVYVWALFFVRILGPCITLAVYFGASHENEVSIECKFHRRVGFAHSELEKCPICQKGIPTASVVLRTSTNEDTIAAAATLVDPMAALRHE